MNHLARVSSIVGGLLVGLAAWIILTDRSATRSRRSRPPVEKLADDLKHAWTGYHTP